MKTIILLLAIAGYLNGFTERSQAKSFTSVTKSTATSFSFVRGHKQGKNTAVTWGMNNNSGINHFMVECTYEDPYDPYSVWQSVGVMPCTNSPIFKFIDSPYLPGTLNYRIIAVMNNNSIIISEIYTTYIP